MNQNHPNFWEITVKSICTHTITYMLMGLLASSLFNYGNLFANTSLNVMMRQIADPWVMAGPLFQPIRGILFGIVFYLLRESFFWKKERLAGDVGCTGDCGNF